MIKHNIHNILPTIFVILMMLVSALGFAHRYGYILPDWVGFMALVAMVLNYIIFGVMIANSDAWVRKRRYRVETDEGGGLLVEAYSQEEANEIVRKMQVKG